MSTKYYFTGLPLSHFPYPPSEWSAAFVMKCPDCDIDMWMSEKKLALSKTMRRSQFKMMCAICIVIETKGKGKIIDILKVKI
jgi:hypothetical protein